MKTNSHKLNYSGRQEIKYGLPQVRLLWGARNNMAYLINVDRSFYPHANGKDNLLRAELFPVLMVVKLGFPKKADCTQHTTGIYHLL